MRHGHVTPNADGSLARCGGPGMCSVCNAELAQLTATSGQLNAIGGAGGAPYRRETIERVPPETYRALARCVNCSFGGRNGKIMDIPKGTLVDDRQCPTCGCTRLVSVR